MLIDRVLSVNPVKVKPYIVVSVLKGTSMKFQFEEVYDLQPQVIEDIHVLRASVLSVLLILYTKWSYIALMDGDLVHIICLCPS